MIGKFKLKRVNKSTGDTDILLEEYNQTAAGFSTAITNVLTGTGSSNVNDYKFRYFQLGTENYNLSSFGVSADVPLSRLKGEMWTIKNPLGLAAYGNNSILPVLQKDVYGLGSILPKDNTKVFDNFIDPPYNTKVYDDYTNNFQTFLEGQLAISGGGNPDPKTAATPSSIWAAGGADEWSKSRYWVKHILWTSAAPTNVSGPDYVNPVYTVQYNGTENVAGVTGCININNDYIYTDKSKANPWNVLKTNQTASVYYSTEYYASSLTTSSSTPIGGALEIFNNTAKVGTGYTSAAQNRVAFMYRYDLGKSSSDAEAKWYPPVILGWDTSAGYDRCVSEGGACQTAWEGLYGSGVSGGEVSANVHCSAGAMYTYEDAQGGYVNRNGPGKDCYDTSNSGFGPSGNFYRISVSLLNVPDEIINFNNGTLSKADTQIRQYPLLSSLSAIDSGTTIGDISGHQVTPREKAYLSNFQFEYDADATEYQNIEGERPYYLTTPQHFVQIPYSYSTTLNDNTINVRLLLDEYLANGQSIKEVGLFLQNPGGSVGIDTPHLSSYKILDPPLQKNEEFSYIIDWELSVVDIDNI